MSDILILGSADFVGSNLTNYMIQNTKYTVASVDLLVHDEKQLRNLAPALGSKARHTFYLADVADKHVMSRILDIEQPRVVIYNCVQRKGGQHEWWDEVKKFKEFCHAYQRTSYPAKPRPEKLVVLYGPQYGGAWWWELLDAAIERFAPENTYRITSCELFGPRQTEAFLGVSGAAGDYLHYKEDFEPKGNTDPRQWMYIRDYFFTLLNLIEKNDVASGKYQVMSGQWATEKQIQSFIRHLIKGAEYEEWDSHEPGALHEAYEDYKHLTAVVNSDLLAAVEHTTAWYNTNEWVWGY